MYWYINFFAPDHICIIFVALILVKLFKFKSLYKIVIIKLHDHDVILTISTLILTFNLLDQNISTFRF
jgi:hypothetical protein